MGNCQTALGKSCSSSNEDGARLDLKSKESIVGDNQVNMSPNEPEIDASASGSVAVSTNRELLTLILDSVAPLGVSTSNTELAEVEVGSVSSSTSSSSIGGVEEERREVVDNDTGSVASGDSLASSAVIVEDVSHQSEDDEIRDLHDSNRNLHPSEGQLMEPTSESSLDESSAESTPSSTAEINGPVSAEKSIDVTKANVEEDELHTSPSYTKEEPKSSKPHPQCSPRKSLHVPVQDTNQNGDLDAIVKKKKDESNATTPKEEESSPQLNPSNDSPHCQQQHSEEVQNFLLFTGTTDHNIANQYLEMSGPHNVNMAVSLYVDHQQQSQRARQKTVQPPPPPPPKKKSWVQVGNKWVPVDKSCISKLPADNNGTVPQELTLKPQKAVSPLPAPFHRRRRVGSPPMVVSPDTNYIPNDVTSVQLSVSFTSLQPDTFRDCKLSQFN